ncbi:MULTISPECIES: sensor histidine kinase [unclassified Cobetia]|uniref:sensor histidine kinase n=1 Tax=unclassified Cobetia TaxID=2609414 RepID=UPI00178CFFDB|nr:MULTISPECIES: sensor histidine kinase [unclassified Cobetia]MBE2168780.1 sensor histidine kinase N-terminal domain-containing protein [Cobetia sp. 2AS1]MDH2447652.1 sensor histidine kinase N-terminal domain-containing protein [Cobetia sp. 2AS]
MIIHGKLRNRLLGWLLSMMLIVGGLLMMDAWVTSQRSAQRAFDSQLEDALLTMTEAIQWQDDQPRIMMPPAALKILSTRHQERVFYRLIDDEGRVLANNLDIALSAKLQREAAEGDVWHNIHYQGVEWRLHARSVRSAGWERQFRVQVWVGHTIEGREQLARELLTRAMGRILVMGLFAAMMIFITLRLALTPLKRLRHQLRRRQPQDASPLSGTMPEEMRELTDTLEQLFHRQGESRDALLRFTADASHQLRTPLAGVQNAAEFALGSDSPAQWHQALSDIHASAARTSRLAGQLLNLTRLRHLALPTEQDALDLADLLRSVVLEWVDHDLARQHDLGLAELPAQPICVIGEPWALREMIGNLIENALRYTPVGSEITLGLSLEAEGGGVVLSIEDNGPGVDPQMLERLCQPFERAGRQDTDGSGLGLAIVETIALRHQAELQVSNRDAGGLCVHIRFPGRQP